MARVYNFSAGPSMLPEKVLKQAQAELLEYGDSGQSVMEMSHRSKWFDAIITDTEATLRRVMNIPDHYKVGFFQGGATQQFAMVPLNFMTTGKADYIVTGNFSNLAAKEAAKFGEANIVASSKDKNFTYIPDVNAIPYNKDASYIHICQNNTIFGTQYVELPQVEGVPLVDRYDAYQALDDEWQQVAQDLEVLQTEGFDAVRRVDPRMVMKKQRGQDVEVQDGWAGHVLPFELVQRELLSAEAAEVTALEARLSAIGPEVAEVLEGLTDEERSDAGDAVNETGDAFVPARLKAVAKALRR